MRTGCISSWFWLWLSLMKMTKVMSAEENKHTFYEKLTGRLKRKCCQICLLSAAAVCTQSFGSNLTRNIHCTKVCMFVLRGVCVCVCVPMRVSFLLNCYLLILSFLFYLSSAQAVHQTYLYIPEQCQLFCSILFYFSLCTDPGPILSCDLPPSSKNL